jgi:dTDP-4-dehydrorhamnose reductase
MSIFAVLGSTGMIGSGVTRYLSEKMHQIFEVNRDGISTYSGNQCLKFDASKENVESLISQIPSGSTILNFIGVIRHKIDETQSESVANAVKINSEFPRALAMAVLEKDVRIIQVGTDCIFSGSRGSYNENFLADPIDVYGRTKLEGEQISKNVMTLRVSVIGREHKSHIELMDWVLGTKSGEVLNGFKNHFWNGVTTLHLARVIEGIVSNDLFRPGTFHLVPQDKISKSRLIALIASFGDRKDIRIREFEGSTYVDRTLTTDFAEFNKILWGAAGYSMLPTIDLMVEEYFAWFIC